MNSSQELLLALEAEMQYCCGTTCNKPQCQKLLTELKESLEDPKESPKENQ